MADLDQSGFAYQRTRVYLGPSLGWVTYQVRPAQTVIAGGATSLGPGASLVLVNVAATVTIILPDVTAWLKEVGAQPATAFDRSIWIKDLGGNAAAFNITVAPFGSQTIDTLSSFTMISNHAMIRLYPLNDLTGWFVG